ncbi:MAG: general secretion pathway protein GspB [Nitrosomonadales bacterium]|nr:general secretion pathway protein GspB [Nitrosomonadales bacterium]
MSYILDALKKSDQQRQRGTTPTLPSAQAAVAAPKQTFSVYYGVLAAVLLCAGIAIGWLRPWQPEQPVHAAEPIAARPAISNSTAQVLRFDQPEPAGQPERELPAPNPAPAAPILSSQEPAIPATADQEQKAMSLSELPLSIQQELPAMKIQLHSYSSKSVNSIVSINSRMMKEGESLAPGLKLEQITPDGVILSYKGYRFQHGIW